ncbi:SLC33A1, partial [Symbiodinium pilosum]
YAGKPPEWEVCWDFSSRHKQGSTWTEGPYVEAQMVEAVDYHAWAQSQQPWWPQTQPQFWPDPSWQYNMPQLLQMQASVGSSYSAAVQEADTIALPPSLEKRLQELKSNKAATKPAAPPPPDREFEGSVKSLSDRHGYGFIACQDVHRIYGRDTYVPKDLLPDGIKVLDRVIFKIGLSKKGHPQVTQIRRALAPSESTED